MRTEDWRPKSKYVEIRECEFCKRPFTILSYRPLNKNDGPRWHIIPWFIWTFRSRMLFENRNGYSRNNLDKKGKLKALLPIDKTRHIITEDNLIWMLWDLIIFVSL
jgi:hypothetical protein